MTKEQWEKILSVLLGAAIAIAAVTGWVIRPVPIETPTQPNVFVVSPGEGRPAEVVVVPPAGGVAPAEQPEAPVLEIGAQALAGDLTNFSGGVEVDVNSSSVEGLDIDQTGTGDIAVFRDGGSAVWTLADGGSVTYGGGLDLNGNTLTIDADADTTLAASLDDIITTTLGAATGSFDIATGNLRVGNGTNGVTLNGEDAYIEGTLEVDGLATLDGGADVNGATVTIDADADTTLAASADDIITITIGAATGSLDIATGNLKVGNGTSNDTLNGEDAYIEGTLEVDGAVNLDGAIDVAGAATLNDDLNAVAQTSITMTVGTTITPTGMYQPLTSNAGQSDGVSDIAAGSSNELLILHNINSTGIITIDGTGSTVECKADVSLDAGDTLVLIYDSANSVWRCISNYDNS